MTTLTCGTGLCDANLEKDIGDGMACNSTNLESFTITTIATLQGEDAHALVTLSNLKSVTLHASSSWNWWSRNLARLVRSRLWIR